MTAISDAIDRIRPTMRPPGSAIGHHRWTNLLFLHWRLPARQIERLLPAELTLDTWEGDAWVGLVPFHMSRVRPWWFPPVPWVSSFCETNVRTYVHFRGRDPGVWFFSLDASGSLAVRVARWRWHLPYYRSRMKLRRQADRVHYASRRLWPDPAGAACQVEARLGAALGAETPARSLPPGRALPGTLEHFLVERYLLYAQPAPCRLVRGQVHHHPYQLRAATLERCQESLLAAAGIESSSPPCHAIFCDGVDVDVYPLSDVSAD